MMASKVKNRMISLQPWYIVTRPSTDVMSINNEHVIKAIRFIQKNTTNSIQVHDVAEAASMSRRGLERLFRRIIGCSVSDEIRRYRVEHICQMLTDENLNISEIALESGFPSVDHISRYFRRHKGMSPSAYRKLYGTKQKQNLLEEDVYITNPILETDKNSE